MNGILKQAEQFAYRLGVQQMSSNIRLEHQHEPTTGGGGGTVSAYDGKKGVGSMTYLSDGTIWLAEVHPDYQRQGIASAMKEHASQYHPNLHFGPPESMSGEGMAWSKAVG